MDTEAVVETELPEPARARLTRNFLVLAIALLLLKLLLVSQREMVTETYDAESYVRHSLNDLAVVFGGYAGHPPGASLVMALARLLGIPYRIFIEVFLAVAAFLFFRPLVVSKSLGLTAVATLYALLLFHPTLILEMDRAMSDPVGFSLWLAGVGGIIGFVVAPREKLAYLSLGLAVGSFAFAGITRSGEGPIVIVEMVAVALLSILLFQGPDRWRRRRAAFACFCAAVASLAATQGLSAAHYINRGYWGASPVESREWWRLYETLLSIPVERIDRRILVNKATMETAQSFSEDLRHMTVCLQEVGDDNRPEGILNEGIAWAITGCLPRVNSEKQYSILNKISNDITAGARERGLLTSPPALGIIPQPAVQWLPYLPSSIVDVAREAVRTPGSTHVLQNSYQSELFDRALLRRTALVAAGDNPEVFGYQSFIKILYRTVAALFWPLVPIFLVAVAAIAVRSPRVTIGNGLVAFALSVMMIDVLCRVSFYSLVDWILWELDPRYLLGARVLSVVVVATLLTVWLLPAAGSALRPWLTKLTGLPASAENIGHPPPHRI
jgi:hypothetical protein